MLVFVRLRHHRRSERDDGVTSGSIDFCASIDRQTRQNQTQTQPTQRRISLARQTCQMMTSPTAAVVAGENDCSWVAAEQCDVTSSSLTLASTTKAAAAAELYEFDRDVMSSNLAAVPTQRCVRRRKRSEFVKEHKQEEHRGCASE